MRIFPTGIGIKIIFLNILLSGFLPLFSYSSYIPVDDSIYEQKIDLNAEDLIRGERLFYGLVYLENKSINCAGCHNTHVSDTLNWNPDAWEISKKYKDKTGRELSKILLNPIGQKMTEVHKGFNLTPEDIIMIKGYMDIISAQGLKQYKPVITHLILFILASLLFIFSLTDLVILKRIKKKWVHPFILLVTGIFITQQLVIDAIAIGHSSGYSPDQPIKFSHAVHAGQNNTDCLYCHSSAEYSKSAGIPSANVCMNCHLIVRSGKRSGTFELAKVIEAFQNNIPVEWIKINNLPDHVFFSHSQHVTAGGLKCQECHGYVEKLDRLIQMPDMSMGWCINCHRNKKVKFQENKFYSEYLELAKRIKSGDTDSVTVEMIGGTECMKCHY